MDPVPALGAIVEQWYPRACEAVHTFARGLANPGPKALVGGTLLFLIATWLHPEGMGLWR